LFLLGLSILYSLTGHLLFPQIEESVLLLLQEGKYTVPLALCCVLMTMGIACKAALYPFHTWLPNAYASATPTSSALLSSMISKMYIFLLIKIFFRAAGAQVFAQGVGDILFVFSIVGIILGSVDAIREHHFSRMIAYSSVSQIGYIFLGISLGTEMGMAAALFHILAHSAAKSMLFLSASKLREVSGGSDAFRDIRGAGVRAPLAGLAFAIGACSLVGIPLLGGFTAKVFLSQAGLAQPRQYTVSSVAHEGCLRISVKRVPATAAAPAGMMSNHLHDSLQVGDSIDVSAPLGDFTLAEGSGPVVLMAAGIGITPMLAMLGSIVKNTPERSVDFFMVCQDCAHFPLKAEVEQAMASLKNGRLHLFYTRAKGEETSQCRAVRRLMSADLESLPVDADWYICGPVSFMHQQIEALKTRGLAAERIHYEIFGTGSMSQ